MISSIPLKEVVTLSILMCFEITTLIVNQIMPIAQVTKSEGANLFEIRRPTIIPEIIPKNSADKVDKKIEFVNPKVAEDKTPDNAETSTPPCRQN